MKKYAAALVVTFLISLTSVTALKLIYDFNRLVGEATQLTYDTHYDRNPSFFEADDGTYWLFFVRSRDHDSNYGDSCLGKGCDEQGCNCDAAYYDLYYMTSTDEGDTWSSETKIPECSTGQRGMAAFQDDTGRIWVFVSSPKPGPIQYCTSDNNGVTWTGPTSTGLTGSHVDAFQARNGDIFIFYESGGVQYAKSSDGGSTWTTGSVNATPGMGIPKAMQDANGKLHCVYANWAGGRYYYSTSDDGIIWTPQPLPIDIPNTISCDPVMYQDRDGKYWLFFAPWDSETNSQWIESAYSPDGNVWSLPVHLTDGGYGSEYWWDMWPEVHQKSSGNMLIFYTSEITGGSFERGDGNIWMFKADIPLKERVSKLETDHTARLLSLESWKLAVEKTLKNIIQRLEAIEEFLQNLGQQPAPICPNGICETWLGEDDPLDDNYCPADCPVEEAVDNEVFIVEHWRVACPATLGPYTIIECRAEILRRGVLMTEETLAVGRERKVNPTAGYSIRLYGKIA